ncbi:galectin-2-like isoform X1 [Salvelinus alpinus]
MASSANEPMRRLGQKRDITLYEEIASVFETVCLRYNFKEIRVSCPIPVRLATQTTFRAAFTTSDNMAMPMELELKHVELRAGDQFKVQGRIMDEAERFQIDLGCDEDDLALHFNPRFNDDTDGTVLVCNSKIAGCWGDEKREIHNPLQRGSTFKIVLKLTGDMFEVEMPDGQEIQFPNREGLDVITYIRIKGDLKLTSFKIY